jgi:hypothetical protein
VTTLHLPNLAIVPCLACGCLIDDPLDLVKDGPTVFGCCAWNGYHEWCIRDAPPYATSWEICGQCAKPIERALAIGAARWLATLDDGAHGRGEGSLPAVPLRRVRVTLSFADRLPIQPPIVAYLDGDDAAREVTRRPAFELVHPDCMLARKERKRSRRLDGSARGA